jgi:hypothetical protein
VLQGTYAAACGTQLAPFLQRLVAVPHMMRREIV